MSDSPRELSVTALIDAAPDKVWQVMTERMAEWWCPKPWTVTLDEIDLRSGGRCAMTMHGPEGEAMPTDGIFLEVVPGSRFVTTDAVVRDAGGRLAASGPFMIGGWEIEPEGSGTRFTGWARHWTDEAQKQHEEMGFTPGWGAVAEQLKSLCEAAD
ncbi:SRPBCC domain-containing protein [Sphingopyxis sp. BSN-002]|uniref:SRPBCC domain-containing protein n=1 Tax=Sphingopyxis sp. BSN-002 TaxID=2911495 RepID=UPI001EDA1194|nr:SRPBCC domain-containing protein [Sphingopyxis sp. BSN-002]UKK86230.1 SRPBCC domain-containing protein [Sphingopyxis sp. BSN-002]